MSSVETRSNFEILLRFSATGTMFTPLVNLSVRDCNYQKTDLNNFHVTPAPAISISHKGSKSISVSEVKGRCRKRTAIRIRNQISIPVRDSRIYLIGQEEGTTF